MSQDVLTRVVVDDDGRDDVAKKNNLCPFKLCRVYLDPLNLSNVGNVSVLFFVFLTLLFTPSWLLRLPVHVSFEL